MLLLAGFVTAVCYGIVQVGTSAVTVFVPKYGIEGPIYLVQKLTEASSSPAMPALEGDFVVDEDKQTVTSHDGQLRFAIFDALAVRISVVEGAGRRRKLLLELADGTDLMDADRME